MRGHHFVRKDHSPRFHHPYDLFQSLDAVVDPDECCDICDDTAIPAVALVGYSNEDDVWDELPVCFGHIGEAIDRYHYGDDQQADVTVFADVDLVTGKWVEAIAANVA